MTSSIRNRACAPLLAALAAACASPGTPSPGSPAGPAEGAPPLDPVARLERTAPGKEVARLAPLVGRWRLRSESLDPVGLRTSPAAEGTAEIVVELGGRLFSWSVRVEVDGQPVRSRGLLAYDVDREVYQLLWISELASGMRVASGRGDPERGGIELESAERDPETGALSRARTVLELEGRDAFTLEQRSFEPTSGKWVPRQRTRYERIPGG